MTYVTPLFNKFAPPAQRTADVGASGLTPAPTGGQAATSQTVTAQGGMLT